MKYDLTLNPRFQDALDKGAAQERARRRIRERHYRSRMSYAEYVARSHAGRELQDQPDRLVYNLKLIEQEFRPEGAINVFELPEDMQSRILDAGWAEPHASLRTFYLPCSAFPFAPLNPADRGESYADKFEFEGPRGENIPPVIVVNRRFMDGKHRLWKARKEFRSHIRTIDEGDTTGSMGEIKPFKQTSTRCKPDPNC